MPNYILKYISAIIYFFFIHYLSILFAFSFLFTFQTRLQYYPHLTKKTIDLLKKEVLFTEAAYYANFFTRVVSIYIEDKPEFIINNLVLFGNRIAIPYELTTPAVQKENLYQLKTKLPYYKIEKKILYQIINITKSFHHKFNSILQIILEEKNKIILSNKEITIYAYPWQTISEEYIEENKKIIDIRVHYKKSYEI